MSIFDTMQKTATTMTNAQGEPIVGAQIVAQPARAGFVTAVTSFLGITKPERINAENTTRTLGI